MIRKLIRKFVCNYIKNNMSHADNRNHIFTALNDGMYQTFNEDNIHARLGNTVEWLLMCDEVAQEIASRRSLVINEFPHLLATAIGSSVADGLRQNKVVRP